MTQNDVFQPISLQRPVSAKLLLLFGFVLLGLVFGSLLGQFVAASMVGVPLNEFQKVINQPSSYPNSWLAIIVLQGVSALVGFCTSAWLYLRLIERTTLAAIAPPLHPTVLYGLIAIVTVSAFPFNGWVAEWNQNLHFPEPIDSLFRTEEKKLALVTKFLTEFNEPWQLVVGLIVIALIPAIGEELVFRGTLQPILLKGTKNVHLAVWVSAFIFSTAHFQFFGFVPRLLLGALLGYLTAWTGSLQASIVSHFVNNGVTLLMVYLFKTKVTILDQAEKPSISWMAAIGSLVIVVLLLRQIRSISIHSHHDTSLDKNL
ncbi:MAG: CPBP family intramembrane glutamic endopeptidase [Spirosomataceae bacterium]